ncbi:hypothetical protein VA7868_03099 [Vibrio aerogenes CECT 7868]|uniref:Septum site-determining protein MinD n=1 Tax=Vibrio aerogenes CECT 7868 TaxID=1216006 RepID=A0A1M5ZRB2_9VIBR|nr:chromosome partitioning protein ParA [Vibrio aerogenes]SHI26770.1 hypothetical protein VA7868_03099 [Vibrio aerogenes CECT 7868]
MLDILDSLNKFEKKNKDVIHVSCVAFVQSDECHQLIEEAFRFEGIALPGFVANTDNEIRRHAREKKIDIALVELNQSPCVTEDMKRISHLLPNDASVIVIGQEDAISTIRNLKAMGFYYLFWPVTKQELIDFVKNVRDNRIREAGLGKKRTAKRIAIWGCKGGVGASLLTSEIAYSLSDEHQSKCLVVDHSYDDSNLDIYLKLEGFERKMAVVEGFGSELDDTYAISMTRKVNHMLSLLSITSEQHPEHEMKEYTRLLEGLLSEHYNFLIEDLSRGNQSRLDFPYLNSHADTVVIVLTPLVSAVRQAKKVMTLLSGESQTRHILVLNHLHQSRLSVLNRAEIEDYLGAKIDVEIPFDPKIVRHILDGDFLTSLRLDISAPLHQLTSMILGENVQTASSGLTTRLFNNGLMKKLIGRSVEDG